ncbi:MAG TPA: iron donor protein CyaY [Halioglobus sp.]
MILVQLFKAQIIPPASKRCEQPLLLNCAHFGDTNSMMTEAEFNERIDQTFSTLEAALDKVDAELDYEISGGVLTVVFDNDTKLIFSRQPPTRQLWLAARAGGFHFAYDEAAGDWRGTRDGQLFRPFVVERMQEQGNVDFQWI